MRFLVRGLSSLVGRALLLGAASALGLTALWPGASTSPQAPEVTARGWTSGART